MTKIETYKGLDIYEKPNLVGGRYYIAPTLTTKKAPVNFAPSIIEMRKLVDYENES